MEELVVKLSSVPNSCFGFVMEIVTYIGGKKPERLQKVLQFVDNSDNLTLSDDVKLVMLQPDFRENGLGKNIAVGFKSSKHILRKEYRKRFHCHNSLA